MIILTSGARFYQVDPTAFLISGFQQLTVVVVHMTTTYSNFGRSDDSFDSGSIMYIAALEIRCTPTIGTVTTIYFSARRSLGTVGYPGSVFFLGYSLFNWKPRRRELVLLLVRNFRVHPVGWATSATLAAT